MHSTLDRYVLCKCWKCLVLDSSVHIYLSLYSTKWSSNQLTLQIARDRVHYSHCRSHHYSWHMNYPMVTREHIGWLSLNKAYTDVCLNLKLTEQICQLVAHNNIMQMLRLYICSSKLCLKLLKKNREKCDT